MNQIFRLLTVAALTSSAILPVSAAKKRAEVAAPASKATRPTDKNMSQAHQKAVNLTKQAADAYAKGNYNKAAWLCKTAADAYPTYARAQTWLGASYHKMGKYSEARKAYKWALALAPETADAQRAQRGLREIGE